MSAQQVDWSLPLFESVYSVDSDTICEKDDNVIVYMNWPGTNTICYGEDIGFYEKREFPNSENELVYLDGSCGSNGYGNKRK